MELSFSNADEWMDMRVRLNGPFRVFDPHGADLTPKGIKERGLLALLLLSPGQRRTRVWIQDKLWSTSNAEQASGSCRQALAKVRKALGPLAERLHSDRSALWLAPQVPVDDVLNAADGELLDDLDIADPEFSDWVSALRIRQFAPREVLTLAAPAQPMAAPRQIALISRNDRSGTVRGAFVLRVLSQRIASRIAAMVDLDVVESDAEDRFSPDPQPAARIELECLEESDIAYLLLRVIGQPNRRIVWSGRLMIAPSLSAIWESEDVTRIVNRTVQAVCDTAVGSASLTPMAAIQRAIRLKYTFDRASLAKADELLRRAADSHLQGLALAWNAMVRLDEVHEFRENDLSRIAEGVEFAERAVRLLPDNSAVLAMASEVAIYLTDDLDKAAFFAKNAVMADDQDPDALAAVGRALSYQGQDGRAHQMAMAAHYNAQGSPYSSDWDMMLASAKIRIGDLAGAFDYALASYRKVPFGRHALRYLTILSYLDDRREDAERFALRLRRLEPDFGLSLLLANYQPISSRRDANLLAMLRDKLA